MSMATLEREILKRARMALRNPKLRMKDILEWSTGEVIAHEGEVVIWLPDPGCNICILKSLDLSAK